MLYHGTVHRMVGRLFCGRLVKEVIQMKPEQLVKELKSRLGTEQFDYSYDRQNNKLRLDYKIVKSGNGYFPISDLLQNIMKEKKKHLTMLFIRLNKLFLRWKRNKHEDFYRSIESISNYSLYIFSFKIERRTCLYHNGSYGRNTNFLCSRFREQHTV